MGGWERNDVEMVVDVVVEEGLVLLAVAEIVAVVEVVPLRLLLFMYTATEKALYLTTDSGRSF